MACTQGTSTQGEYFTRLPTFAVFDRLNYLFEVAGNDAYLSGVSDLPRCFCFIHIPGSLVAYTMHHTERGRKQANMIFLDFHGVFHTHFVFLASFEW